MANLTAAKQAAPVNLLVNHERGSYTVIDVNHAKVLQISVILPLFRQPQHHAVVIQQNLGLQTFFQQVFYLYRTFPRGLWHALRYPGQRVDLAVDRQSDF